MDITQEQQEVINKFKEEEVYYTFSDYFNEKEIRYIIEEGDDDDNITLIVELTMSDDDKYQLSFRVTDDNIELHVHEDDYEEVNEGNMWKHLFFQASMRVGKH